MQKKIIETPIYETVQTGVNQKEIWVTSDNQEFDNEKYAEQHEFYNCKVKQRGFGLPYDVVVLDLYCLEDLERYEKDYTYNVDHYDYDKSKLTFPKTYVLVEEYDPDEDYDEYSRPDLFLRIYTVDEYKELVNTKLNEVNIL